MKATVISAIGVCLFGGVALAAPPGWLAEFMMVRAPQTQVVRDPQFHGKYYLCWSDGATRYGIRFRRQKLVDNLNAVRPGGRVVLSSIFTLDEGAWTKRDNDICAGRL